MAIQENKAGSATPLPSDVPKPAPELERLNVLVGEWQIKISHPFASPNEIDGRARFEWIRKGGFLVQRTEVENPDFPDSIAIIGWDASAGTFIQHYFDSRGVARVYTMSLDDGSLKFWRIERGFSQRFTGNLSRDGKTMQGEWSKSSDGVSWEHDFDMTFTKE